MEQKDQLNCQCCHLNFSNLVICLNCKLTLCQNCNYQLHNKPTFADHCKISLLEKIQKKTKNNLEIFIFCSNIQRNYFLDCNSQKNQTKRMIFEYVVQQTQKGSCLVSFKKIFKFLNIKDKKTQTEIQNYLMEDINSEIYKETKRAYGTKKHQSFISLKIEDISIQLISFILKSIFQHKMEPNHVLIHSRIKEYFGIKIKMKDWKKFVDNLYTNKQMQQQITMVSHLIEGFKVVPSQEGNFLFEPFDYKWEYQDTKPSNQNDPDYLIFLNCMQDFFNRQNCDSFQFLTANPERWNICQELQDDQKKSLLDLLKEKQIDKAIPGGKYGCGLLLKKLYSKELKNIKLGKVIRMIKRSLKEQRYIHEKTLIYKNNKQVQIDEQDRQNKIAQLKQIITTQLEQSKSKGISLSQLPQIIKEQLGYQPDFEALGFPKLKQFIETITNVFVLKNSENHISIKLKKYTTWQEEKFPNQSSYQGKSSQKSKQSKNTYRKNKKNKKFQIGKKNSIIISDLSSNNYDSQNDFSDGQNQSYLNYKLSEQKLMKFQENKFKHQPLDTQLQNDNRKNFIKYLKMVLKINKKPMNIPALKYQMQQMFHKNKLKFNFPDKEFKNQLFQLQGKLIKIDDALDTESEYYYGQTQQIVSLLNKGSNMKRFRKSSMAYSDQNCIDRSDSFKQTNQSSKEQFNLWSGNTTPKNTLFDKNNFGYLSDTEKLDQISSRDSSNQRLQGLQGIELISEQSSVKKEDSNDYYTTSFSLKQQLSFDGKKINFPNFPYKSNNQFIMLNNLNEQFIQEQHPNQSPNDLDEGIQKLLEQFKKEIDKNFLPALDRVDENNLGGFEKCLMIFFNVIFFIFILPIFCGFFQIEPNEIVVIETFGKPVKVMQKPGLNWYFPIGTKFRKVKKSLQTEEIFGSSVPDMYGSPLNISVVITYTISNALANLYNIKNSTKYLHSQAMEVVRRVVSQFKYRSNDPNEHTLIKDSMIIGKYMKELLNIKLKIAGVIITRMELMEISYHTEIAQGMLQIQQAQAKVEARKEIVKGGVLIVKDALIQLEEQQVELQSDTKQKLTKDLMIVVCSDFGKPQPVLNI